MPQLSIYTAVDAIRPEIVCAIRALLASEWPASDGEPARGPLADPTLHPVFVVLTSAQRVLSFGRTIWAWVPHDGRTLKVYGLGDVITAPESRRAGYGGRVVEAATAHIRSDPNADLGLLLTDPQLEGLYGHRGWIHVPGLGVVTDEYHGEHTAPPFPMVLLRSSAGPAARAELSKQTLVLPGDEW
jgi:GNAT superfamily N-acetyltransferase